MSFFLRGRDKETNDMFFGCVVLFMGCAVMKKDMFFGCFFWCFKKNDM